MYPLKKLLINLQSLFEQFKQSLTTEKTAKKKFGIGKQSVRSFMHTKENNGPKIDPLGTPAFLGDQLDD